MLLLFSNKLFVVYCLRAAKCKLQQYQSFIKTNNYELCWIVRHYETEDLDPFTK